MTEPVRTWIPLLLADPSPCLRLLVLRHLLRRAQGDPEMAELEALRHTDPLVVSLLALQDEDGAWRRLDVDATGSPVRLTSQALLRLAYLGFGSGDAAVRRAAAYLFGAQQGDGSWPLAGSEQERAQEEGYDMVPLQTAIPLRALAGAGFAQDPRAEAAYEWLLCRRLEDGAWPSGVAAGVYGYVAGYRRLAHSRWGCRSNTTGALLCLTGHPERRRGPEAQRALDLLLGRETRERQALGFEVARTVGAEAVRGFFTYYAMFDGALLLNLCAQIGASTEDQRVADLAAWILEQQGEYGLWTYGRRPQVSRWITFDILRCLQDMGAGDSWVNLEARTPFRPYWRRRRRY